MPGCRCRPLRKVTVDILIFELANAQHALPLDNVREVVRAVAVTPLPNAPSVIEGIINVRGTITSVLSLRSRFDYPERPVQPQDFFLLGTLRDTDIALHVDKATELAVIDDDTMAAIQVPVSQDDYTLPGVAALPDGLLLIHDLESFLSEGETDELQAALDGLEGEP